MKAFLAVVILAAFLLLEKAYPFFPTSNKIKHDINNLVFALINAVISSIIFSVLIITAMSFSFRNEIGLLWRLDWPAWMEFIIAFLLFDLWMYGWHVMNHKVGFFWRFHRMHHSDKAMDATSALRFHPGEILLSGLARVLIVPLIGMYTGQLIIYEIILQLVIVFHHSNLDFPEKWDSALRRVIVTPNMHRVHHSHVQRETDSNYSSVFSIWDRLFKTLILRKDCREIRYGVEEFDPDAWQSLLGMIKTPFAPLKAK